MKVGQFSAGGDTILQREHSEWANESLDGFFWSSTIKSDNSSAELVGTCILISDQTVTPIALNITVVDSRTLGALRIRLGEAGEGALGISGPTCNSAAAIAMLHALNGRLPAVDWVYDVVA